MNKKTIAALKLSIGTWERRAAGAKIEVQPENCALCDLFYRGDCIGCPVMQATGSAECRGTPCEVYTDMPNPNRDMARAEVYFLKALLPRRNSTSDRGGKHGD